MIIKIGDVWYITIKNDCLKHLSFNDSIFYTLCDIYDNSTDEFHIWRAFHFMSKLTNSTGIPNCIEHNYKTTYSECLNDVDFVFKLYEWLSTFTFYVNDYNVINNFDYHTHVNNNDLIKLEIWSSNLHTLKNKLYVHYMLLGKIVSL